MTAAIEGRAVRRAQHREWLWALARVRRAQLIKLEAFASKGHWDREDTSWLLKRAGEELKELRDAIAALEHENACPEPDAKRMAQLWQALLFEAADVCNFVAMAVDQSHHIVDWRG